MASNNLANLVESLSNYLDASREHDDARKAYEGHSWGWAGGEYIRRVDEAASELEKRLDGYIESRVNAILSARTKEAILLNIESH